MSEQMEYPYTAYTANPDGTVDRVLITGVNVWGGKKTEASSHGAVYAPKDLHKTPREALDALLCSMAVKRAKLKKDLARLDKVEGAVYRQLENISLTEKREGKK